MLIIIPAYNEENSILNTVRKLNHIPLAYDYIVVNDGSTDRTQTILEDYNINHLCLPTNLGIGGAMQTGYKYAQRHNFDFAIQLDADGQHDSRDLDILLNEINQTKSDIVIGSRFVEKSSYRGSIMRRVGIYYFYFIVRFLTNVKVTDPTSGYRIVNKRVINEFSRYYPLDYPEVEVIVNLARKRYRIKEVKVEMNEREQGISSITPIKSVYYMIKVTYLSFIRAFF